MEIDDRVHNTNKLLLELSKHLSGKGECKDAEYKLVISRQSIKFSPDILVFPNRHIRCKSSKRPVLYHILSTEFLQNDCLCSHLFVEGEYKYSKPYNSKKRNWLRSVNYEN